MSQIMPPDRGVYNPAQRYKIKNILDRDYTTYWNGNPLTIKAGSVVTVPEYLADKIVNELVDVIMIGEVKIKQEEWDAAHPDNRVTKLHQAASSLGVPLARKVWEDKIILEKVQLEAGSTESQLLRMQVQEELERDLKAEPSTEPVQAPPSITVLDTTGLDKGRQSLSGMITNEEEFSSIKRKSKK